MRPVAIIISAAVIFAAGCSVRSDRVVEKPASTTTQRTTVTEAVPGHPTATTTTTTTTTPPTR